MANRSAAAKKAWLTRRGATGAGLSAAKAAGAIVNRGLLDHIVGMKQHGLAIGPRIKRMPIQGMRPLPREARQALMRQRRIGNVNAIRIARGQKALVFQNQGKPHRWPRRFR